MVSEASLKKYYEKQGNTNFNRQHYWNENPYRREFHRARKRAIMKLLRKYYQPEYKILDAGCGDGEYIRHFNTHKKSHGIDISSSFIKRAKKRDSRTHYVVGSIERLPFKDNFFSMVICSETLEHVLDYDKALSEICRIGRSLFISIPIEKTHPFVRLGLKILGKKEMMSSDVKHGGHLRHFTKKQIINDIKKNDFEIIKTKTLHCSALIAVFYILSEKFKSLNKSSKTFIPLIKFADKFFPWGLTYIIIAKKERL